MSMLGTAPLILRRRGGLADLLPITAFAASTGILATVLGGLGAFAARATDVPQGVAGAAGAGSVEQTMPAFLLICAVIATALLVPTAMGLGGAAARLSLSRRERDLATVRLVGGTSGQVGTLAVVDVLAQAVIGSLLGLALHLAVTPALTALDFGMSPFTVTELLLPWWGCLLLLTGAVALAALAAAIGLSGVVISPLGVARDSRVVRMSVMRIAVWVLLLVAFVAAFQLAPQLAGGADAMAVVVAVLAVLMAMVIGSVNVVGPFVVWLTARAVAALAPVPSLLVGARRLAADPWAGWRSVSGITFGLVIAGFLTLLTVTGSGQGADEDAVITALNTGGYLTLAIAAVLAAVSTGVTQTARVLDQAAVYRSQHVIGAPMKALQTARIVEIGIPLGLAGVIATISALALVAPMVSGEWVTGAMLRYVLSAASAIGLVAASVAVSAPLVTRVARRAA